MLAAAPSHADYVHQGIPMWTCASKRSRSECRQAIAVHRGAKSRIRPSSRPDFVFDSARYPEYTRRDAPVAQPGAVVSER